MSVDKDGEHPGDAEAEPESSDERVPTTPGPHTAEQMREKFYFLPTTDPDVIAEAILKKK